MKKADFILLISLGVLIATILFFATGSHTIVLRKDGFYPRTLALRVGETVIFTSEEGKTFWPASDPHPVHTLFSAFDAQKPIAPNDSWSFTFTKPGTFPYHDHLNAAFTGTIIVAGSLEEARKACLVAQADNVLMPECWGLEIQDILAHKNLSAAFAYVDDMYASDPRFRNNCHDVMHILGVEAYKKFKTRSMVTDFPETSYCGYGFYHGFIEEMLTENGPYQYAEVRKYCEEAGVTGGEAASGPCFHGIGHAIFDSLEASLWGDSDSMVNAALSRCADLLTTSFALRQCGDGVFNSFANAMSVKNYSLSFTSFDPVSFCSPQATVYRQECFGETGIGYIREKRMSMSEAGTFMDSLDSALRRYMYFIYFSDELKRAIKGFPENGPTFRDFCTAIPDTDGKEGCVRGVLEGLREESPAGQSYRYTFPFCVLFEATALLDFCANDVVKSANAFEKETLEFQAACRALGRTEVECK